MTRGWGSLFAIDLRSLALFRIGLACLLLANLAYCAVDLEAWFTDFGVLPRIELQRLTEPGALQLSLHTWSGGAALQVALFLLSAATAVALGLGFHTRSATLASWLLLVSLQNRNPLILTGGDELLRLMLLWSSFLPLGAVASLDARRTPAPLSQWSVVSVAGAALLLQIALLYPISALFKLREPAWQSLEALRLALSVDGAATSLVQPLRAAPSLGAPLSRTEPWLAASAAALGACALLHNAATLGWIDGDERGPRGLVRRINWSLRLDQYWSLWSDPPSNRYFVAAARTHDGRKLDLRRDGAPLDFAAPRLRSRDSHWWKLELGLSQPELAPFRRGYGCHLLRAWNRRSAQDDRVASASGWVLLGERAQVRAGNAQRVPFWEIELSECDRLYPVTAPAAPGTPAAHRSATRTS